MPRIHPLPATETAIGRRLAQVRRARRLSRHDLAKPRLPFHIVARIELGRMPLRYEHALMVLPALARGLPVTMALNPLWVAEATPPVWLEWPLALPPPESIGIPGATPFSEFVANNRAVLVGLAEDPPRPCLPETWLIFYLLRWGELLASADSVHQGIGSLGRVLRESAARLAPQSGTAMNLLARIRAVEKRRENEPLTHVVASDKIAAMQNQMDRLRSRLTRATAVRGQKAALANWLGVPLSSISTWLSGRREPGGEIALRLLQWAEQQEGKRATSPGSVPPPPGRKAQLHHSSNEKDKPGRRRA